MDQEMETIKRMSALQDTVIGRYAFQTLDAIDAKTASLLTHVSIMLAVLGFFYSNAREEPEKTLILVEIIAYILISAGCLRSIFTTDPKTLPSDPEALCARMLQIGKNRSQAFLFCLRATITVSCLFLVTVGLGETHVIDALMAWLTKRA